eukprot:2177880-Prymnesium_polylepis.1
MIGVGTGVDERPDDANTTGTNTDDRGGASEWGGTVCSGSTGDVSGAHDDQVCELCDELGEEELCDTNH